MGSFDVLTPMPNGTIARQHFEVTMFMNEHEIDQAMWRYENHPVLGPAARTLGAVRDQVNSCSDGWPYWKAPSRACRKLMALFETEQAAERDPRKVKPTAVDLKAALIPVKAFYTRHGYTFPEVR